jgi:hypothetical protein
MIVWVAVLAGACGGRSRDASDNVRPVRTSAGGTSENTGEPSESSGGIFAGSGGSPVMSAGRSGGTGATPIVVGGGGSAAGGGDVAASAGAAASKSTASGGTTGDAAFSEAGAGGASNSSCSAAWGTPSDPGYRGLHGTLNGQPLDVDGKAIETGISFCFPDGPGTTPGGIGGYIPLPGMSLWFGDCGARVTSPSDTEWHELDIQISTNVALPTMNSTVTSGPNWGQPTWGNTVSSGHLHIEGQGTSGPLSIDADFYLDMPVVDSCAPPPPKVG